MEYALLASLLAVFVIGAVSLMGESVTGLWARLSEALVTAMDTGD